MVKKCFAALLPLVLLFFLAGCLTGAPTEPTEPATQPTVAPTEKPTEKPTEAPTEKPTEAPTEKPTEAPTEEPTELPTEEPTEDPYPLHEISPDMITVDGDEKTYNGYTFALTVPADWLCQEQHLEDGTSYYFDDPALENCQLYIYHTSAEYVYERTEDEYLKYLASSLENVKILSYAKEKLSGFDCIKVAYSYTFNGTAYTAVRYDNIVRGFALLQFRLVYPTAESARLTPVFDAIVDSITVYP